MYLMLFFVSKDICNEGFVLEEAVDNLEKNHITKLVGKLLTK